MTIKNENVQCNLKQQCLLDCDQSFRNLLGGSRTAPSRGILHKGRLRPEVQPLTLPYAILTKKGHFRIPFITQGYKVNYCVRVLHLTYDMRTSQHFSEPISLFTSSICSDIIPRLWRQVFGRYQTLTNNTGGESMETRAHLNMGTKTFFAPLGVGRGVPGPSPYIRHWKAPGLKAPTYFNYKRKSSLYISYKGLYCNWNSFEDQGKDNKVKSSLFKTSLVMTVLEISKM